MFHIVTLPSSVKRAVAPSASQLSCGYAFNTAGGIRRTSSLSNGLRFHARNAIADESAPMVAGGDDGGFQPAGQLVTGGAALTSGSKKLLPPSALACVLDVKSGLVYAPTHRQLVQEFARLRPTFRGADDLHLI